MDKTCQVIVICYIFFIMFIVVDIGDASDKNLSRQRRYLGFRNISRFFLEMELEVQQDLQSVLESVHMTCAYSLLRLVATVRFNFKANMVPWNQIFAQAVGFRVNWDDPPDSFYPHHHIHRRGLYERMEVLLDRNGLNGFHCVRRAVCEVQNMANPEEIYYKILQIVFRQVSSETDKWHEHSTEDCETSIQSCPFSLLEVLPYTDL